MQHASLNFKVKSLAEDGSFEGQLAVYNNVDLGSDLIEPGAFTKTLQMSKTWPLLWQHRPDEPIGSFVAVDSPTSLNIKAQLLMSDPTAQKAHRLLKAGVIKGLSIGFDAIRDSVEDGVRHLKEVRLWEGSIVTFPMNQLATVTSIKAMSDQDREKHMRAIDSHRKSIDRSQRAIREHLKSMFDGLDDDECDLNDNGECDELEGMSMLLSELKSVAEEAEELTEA